MRRTRIRGAVRVPVSLRLRSLTAALLVTTAAACGALLTACDDSSGSSTSPSSPSLPPATGSFSGEVPSVLSSLASAGQSAASAAVSSAGAAASSFAASAEAGAASASAAAEHALSTVSGQGNAVADVGLTGLAKTQTGGLHAVVVTITNRTDKKASYAVKVDFADSSGKVVDSAVVGAAGVAPGKKAQPVAFSTKDQDKTLFPKVAKALRY